MAICFVIQPFDADTFDKRFADIFSPAIEAAGLEPYRVDQDPKVSIPIQDIERAIQDSAICLAEITLDNPNVWFELGYAIACNKEVVLVCSSERKTRFPFDIQHRAIIQYSTSSTSDFDLLKSSITKKIEAYLKKTQNLATLSLSKIAKVEGLDQHEIVALAALAENIDNPEEHASVYTIKRDMEANGFTKAATTFALKSLSQKGFVKYEDLPGDEYSNKYTGCSITEAGWDWIFANKNKFALQTQPSVVRPTERF
jgi:hypothetical protein